MSTSTSVVIASDRSGIRRSAGFVTTCGEQCLETTDAVAMAAAQPLNERRVAALEMRHSATVRLTAFRAVRGIITYLGPSCPHLLRGHPRSESRGHTETLAGSEMTVPSLATVTTGMLRRYGA